ncbi:MAG TPA: hemolysin family protein [Candidatus Omnitrophota bacterium]|nr:hemolysin family protein [Candidatus Omnitrophota bacterium]
MVTFIITVLISLSVSFMCSVLEACLLSLSVTDIAKMSEKHPRVADIWKRFKENIEKPIAVVLIVNTFAHTIGAALSGSQFNMLFGAQWVAVYSIVFSLVMIQWTEIMPKTLGVRYNKFFARIIAVPLDLLVKLFTPVVMLAHFLNKPFEEKKKQSFESRALNDISVLARFANINKMITTEQKNIVEEGLKLSAKTVTDVMVPIGEIKCLTTAMSLTDALLESHIHHHTRFPLMDVDKNGEIIGYVNFKDIVGVLQFNPGMPNLRGICRPIFSVNESITLTDLLSTLIKNYQHIAVVRDNTRKITGIVTMEDIIESIVGDINDEYDILPSYLYQISERRYVAGGGLMIADLNNVVGLDIPGKNITVNDWLLSRLNKTPKAEDHLKHGNAEFIVRKVSRAKIREIIVDKVA